jgi:hypothetical protein
MQNILLGDMGYVQRVPLMRLTIFAVAVLVAAIPALAHSWYPLACCGNMDCFPVACDQLVETVSGWLYVPTGNLFKREQVQPSQDLHCHVCLDTGVTIARSARSLCQTSSGSKFAVRYQGTLASSWLLKRRCRIRLGTTPIRSGTDLDGGRRNGG